MVRALLACSVVPAALFVQGSGASAAQPHVLLVGTYNGITGPYTTIQSAVDAAHPGDWVLVGPGDYHERADYANPSWPAGVWIQTPGIHLRGMNRNTVIVDGTAPTATKPCSHNAADQDLGPGGQGRNGIEVYGPNFSANGVSIENLTVCNFLTSGSGGNGNEIWWNGGDGGGKVGLSGYRGRYLTATSTYSSTTAGSLGTCCGVDYPAGSYGIFSSNSTHGQWFRDYASNMSDSAFYVGACQQVCDMVMNQDHGQFSALCLSSTNAGGYFVVEHTECDLNKTGLVNNSQNNDDWPSPQHGACDSADPSEPQKGVLGTTNCTVWEHNYLHDNNNPNVPGNGTSGLAGGGPVGTGLILAGSSDITLYQNRITHNNAWGELIADLPDQESGPANCQGGIWVNPPGVCYYSSVGNVSLDNKFGQNGAYGNPTNGDIGLATLANNPGNCFNGDADPPNGAPGTATTDPPGIETLPQYQPSNGECNQPNNGDMGPLAFEALCNTQLAAPCPSVQQVVCELWAQTNTVPCPLPPNPPIPANYPRPDARFTLTLPGTQMTMPEPCDDVPVNPWCPTRIPVEPGAQTQAATASIGAAALLAIALAPWFMRRRRR